jgi:Pvc16 N-terminal domain
MSNHLAVATVTAALRGILAEAAAVVAGAHATTDDPHQDEGDVAAPRVNVVLYQIVPHAAWRATDVREQTALDLHYLLTFHGEQARFEPQLLLGSAVARLHDECVLSAQRIYEAEEQAPFAAELSSNLALQDDPVTFTPLALTLDDLSKIWSSLFQAPYALSVAYRAGTVLIDREEAS